MKYFSFLISFVFIFNAGGQVDSTITNALEEVIVTGTFGQAEYKKIARTVQVITAKEIAEAPVKTIDGILQYAANVDVRSRGPLGVQADISIRGGHYDQTLILLDGVKLNDPQTGHHSLNLPVSLDMIERIEVLQGGASRVYGPSAFAGVINIVTKKVTKNSLSATLLAGEFGLNKIGGTAGVKLHNKLNMLLSLEQMQGDGFAKNTAFDKLNGHLKISFSPTIKTNIVASGGFMYNKFGASNFYFPSFYDQYENVSSKVAVLEVNHDFNRNFSSQITGSFRKHNDAYDFNKYRLDLNKINLVNYHQTDVWDVAWLNKYQSNLGKTIIGFEYRKEGVISNRLGEKLSASSKKIFNRLDQVSGATLYYTNAKVRENVSVYLDHSYSKNNWFISVGTLLNLNSQFGNELFPGIDFSYIINDKTSFYGSANKSLRFPTFTEMYLNTSTVKADPNLKPEKATTLEIGLKSKNVGFSYNTALFFKRSNAAIDKVKRPNLTIPTMETIGDMNTYGAEASVVLEPTKVWSSLPKFINTLRANYAFIYSDKKEIDFQSFYTLNYLRHKASAGLNLNIVKHLTLDTRYTYKARLGTYQFKGTDPVLPYKPIHLIDTRLNYGFKKFSVFMDATNLFDKSYYEFGFVEQPGRWLSGGISVRL